MDSNASTTDGHEAGPGRLPGEQGVLPARLQRLAAAIGKLAARDPAELGDAALAAQVLALRRLADQLDGVWLRRLAVVDARGAAGAEAGTGAGSTAGWLRAALRISPGAAGRAVRSARALHHGPLDATARALAEGAVSYQHAAALADAACDLPATRVAEAEGCWWRPRPEACRPAGVGSRCWSRQARTGGHATAADLRRLADGWRAWGRLRRLVRPPRRDPQKLRHSSVSSRLASDCLM
jgi:hypothetical protein